jgi:hypothetical protein
VKLFHTLLGCIKGKPKGTVRERDQLSPFPAPFGIRPLSMLVVIDHVYDCSRFVLPYLKPLISFFPDKNESYKSSYFKTFDSLSFRCKENTYLAGTTALNAAHAKSFIDKNQAILHRR